MKKKSIILFSVILILLFLSLFNFNKNKEITNSKTVQNNTYDRDLNYFKNYYSNNDIIGSIKIDDTKINSLLVKTTDNDYYLKHSIDKKEDERGAIFVDYRVNLNSKQINIYGHNSLYFDLPFKTLEKYLNKTFYDNHKYITIWDGNKDIKYLIFSVQVVTNSEHMKLIMTEDHINKLSESIYDTGVNASIDDDILILQTCNYNPKDSYIILVAKKV